MYISKPKPSLTYFYIFTTHGRPTYIALKDTIVQAETTLGYSNLIQEQEQAIASFVSGNDVFVVLPTGFGKSLFCLVISSIQPPQRG